jgi:hypothetical protein
MLFSEVTRDEHASAFLRLRLVGHQSKAPLALKTKGLELRDELAHASGETLRWRDDNDGAFLVPLDEAGFLSSDSSTSAIQAGTPAE